MVVELNRRLVKGYTHYKDDPRIINLKKNVMAYHKSLEAVGVRDHQVNYAKSSFFKTLGKLLWRTGKLILLSAGVFPGFLLFSPVFIAGKWASIRKSREALAASTVKIQARDVVATWKILVAMAFAPALYTWYNMLFAIWKRYNQINGLLPLWVPTWAVVAFGTIFFPMITYAALRFGEIGMDIAKSLRPLLLCLIPSSGNSLVKLRQRREALVNEVTQVINELGPELFPDFDAQRVVGSVQTSRPKTPDSPSMGSKSWIDLFHFTGAEESLENGDATARASIGGGSSIEGHLPRNESFKNLSSFGFFASRPQTPSTDRSRSRPASRGGLAMTSLTPTESKKHGDDLSRGIRGAMRERGRHRLKKGQDSEDADVDSEASSIDEDDHEANLRGAKKEL